MTRLLKMAATKSIKRNLETEDEGYKQDIDTHQKDLWGEGTKGNGGENTGGSGEDDMEIMAARDVSFVHHHHHPAPTTQPEQPKKEGSVSPLAAGLLGAALAIGTGGGGFMLSQILSKPVVVSKIDMEEFEVGLLPPTPKSTESP